MIEHTIYNVHTLCTTVHHIHVSGIYYTNISAYIHICVWEKSEKPIPELKKRFV